MNLLWIAIAAYALLAWKDLRVALLLFIAAFPAYVIRLQVSGLPTTALEILFWILFAAWMLKREKRLIDIKGWGKLLLAWLAVATVSLFVSPDFRAAAGVWKAYFIEPILFFLIACDLLRTHEERDQALRALGASAIAVGGMAIVQHWTGWGVPPPFDGHPIPPATEAEFRSTAFYGFPNAIGLYLAPLAPLFAGCLYADRARVRRAAFWAAALAATVGGIVFAQSEGAIVGVAAGVLAAGLLAPKTRKAAFIAASVAGLLILAVPSARHLAVEKATLEDWSGRVRKEMWAETWNMLKDRPLLGAGLSGYPIVFDAYHKARHIEIFQYPHQLFLDFWTELGLAGVAVFVLLVLRFFHDALSTRAWTLAGSGVALLVHGLVDVPYFKNDLAMLFWLLMAFAAAHAAERRRSHAK